MIEREHFYMSLTQKSVPVFYSSLKNNLNNSNIYTSNLKQLELSTLKTNAISLFPCYLTPTFLNKEKLRIAKIPHEKIKGYAITIKEQPEIDLFLRNQYKKKFRDNITRLVNRLENCFEIQYEMFYGNISKEKCKSLMLDLKDMLKKRFDQRGDKTDVYHMWDEYIDLTYSQIIAKKASIFVISTNNTPIGISINHHINNILFVSIPSYNIDYSKFALGNISIYKLLEWALNNNYSMLDMAYGDLEYKKRWSNYIYKFEHHIIYRKNKFLQFLIASFEINKIKFKNYIKKHNLQLTAKDKKSKINPNDPFSIVKNEEIDLTNYEKTHLPDQNIAFLQKIVFDFLYTHKEHIDNIEIFKNKHKTEFLIKGKSASQKINFD